MDGSPQRRLCRAFRVRRRQGCAEKVDVNAKSPQDLTGRTFDIKHTAQHMVACDHI